MLLYYNAETHIKLFQIQIFLLKRVDESDCCANDYSADSATFFNKAHATFREKL